MNRVMIQEGYSRPFAAYKKKRKSKARGKHRRTAKAKSAQAAFGRKIKACGKKWKAKSAKHRSTHSWKAFLKKCM